MPKMTISARVSHPTGSLNGHRGDPLGHTLICNLRFGSLCGMQPVRDGALAALDDPRLRDLRITRLGGLKAGDAKFAGLPCRVESLKRSLKKEKHQLNRRDH